MNVFHELAIHLAQHAHAAKPGRWRSRYWLDIDHEALLTSLLFKMPALGAQLSICHAFQIHAGAGIFAQLIMIEAWQQMADLVMAGMGVGCWELGETLQINPSCSANFFAS